MKLAYKIAVVLFSICPLLSADNTDIGAYGHVVSNQIEDPVVVHFDIAGKTDAKSLVAAGNVWSTKKSGTVRSVKIVRTPPGKIPGLKDIKVLIPQEQEDQRVIVFITPGEDDNFEAELEYAGDRF